MPATTSLHGLVHRLRTTAGSGLIACLFAVVAAHAQTTTDDAEELYWRALVDRNPTTVRQLLQSGADPNTPIAIAAGAISLHAAAINKRSTAPLQALIEAGGDCNATDDHGQTPLQAAAAQSPLPPTAAESMQLLVQCQSRTAPDPVAVTDNAAAPSPASVVAATTDNNASEQTRTALQNVLPSTSTRPSINAASRCAGKPEGAECWKEVANQPGCFVWDDGYLSDQSVNWSGQCTDGVVSGPGTAFWSVSGIGEFDGFDGTGSYKGGKRHGHWVWRFANGAFEEGRYVDGKPHGHWVTRWADGGVGEGPFVDGKKHGHWVARRADGTVKEGRYVDGKQHGHWVHRFANGTVEEGRYVDGKRHGRWVTRWVDGTCTVDVWNNSEITRTSDC